MICQIKKRAKVYLQWYFSGCFGIHLFLSDTITVSNSTIKRIISSEESYYNRSSHRRRMKATDKYKRTKMESLKLRVLRSKETDSKLFVKFVIRFK